MATVAPGAPGAPGELAGLGPRPPMTALVMVGMEAQVDVEVKVDAEEGEEVAPRSRSLESRQRSSPRSAYRWSPRREERAGPLVASLV